MGQMAASLAHELAQPLASILRNAQAATRFANRNEQDLEEIRVQAVGERTQPYPFSDSKDTGRFDKKRNRKATFVRT